MNLGYANSDETFSEELFDFYATRVDGDVDTIIVGGCYVESKTRFTQKV
jgi:2,4-dienoyl-CoA reductase-like NADH-dependent reductase (Old Yellow Enzyme family)